MKWAQFGLVSVAALAIMLALASSVHAAANDVAYGPTADFTVSLKSGWNLVSVPVANFQQIMCVRAPCYQPMLSNLKSNTCPRDGIKIFAYDRVSKTYREQTSSLDVFMAPYGGFEAGKSYWVKTASDCEMAFDGTHRMFGSVDPLIISSLPPAASIASGSGWALSSGWNNVGAPIDNTEFKKVSAACTLKTLWRYNTAARKWEKAEVLKPGEGYFVKAAGDCGLGINQKPAPTPTPYPVDYLMKLCEDTGGKVLPNCNPGQPCITVAPYCSCADGTVFQFWDADPAFSQYGCNAPKDYCVQDSDCVREPSCCDCGLGKYVNRKYAQEVSCTSPRCMCATQESKGVCESNQCKAVPVDATVTPTPITVPVVNVRPARQLTFTNDISYGIIDFVNINGRRLAIYGKYVYNGMDVVNVSFESLDVDSGQVAALKLPKGMVKSNGRYLTYIEDFCLRYLDLATGVEKTVACGRGSHGFNSYGLAVANGKIYYKDEYFQYPPYGSVPYDIAVNYSVYEYDIATGATREAFRVNKEFSAASDGRALAWFDTSSYRKTATGTPGNSTGAIIEGARSLYYLDPASGSVAFIPVAKNPNYLAVSGNLAYFGAGEAPSRDVSASLEERLGSPPFNAVYAYDMAAHSMLQLTAMGSHRNNLDSDGNLLAWNEGGPENDQIFIYYRDSGAIEQITTGAGFHAMPKVLGDSLIYRGGGIGPNAWKTSNIFLADIK
ncbi:MAG: hypothetical protein V1708_02225 [Candidatus Micrarchaeota archaeon]